MNFWIRAGVLGRRKARRISGSKPRLSDRTRRIPFLDSSLPFNGKAETLLKTLGNYTEASCKPRVLSGNPLHTQSYEILTMKDSISDSSNEDRLDPVPVLLWSSEEAVY
jgi:hypothetical protein